jgi:hypothetical protein
VRLFLSGSILSSVLQKTQLFSVKRKTLCIGQFFPLVQSRVSASEKEKRLHGDLRFGPAFREATKLLHGGAILKRVK